MKNSWLLLAVALLSLNSCQKDQKQSLTASTAQQSVPFTTNSPREALAAMPRLALSLNAKYLSVANNPKNKKMAIAMAAAAAAQTDDYSALLAGPADSPESYPSPCGIAAGNGMTIQPGDAIAFSIFPGTGFVDPVYSFQISTDGIHWKQVSKLFPWDLPYDDSKQYPYTDASSPDYPCETIVKHAISFEDEGLFVRARIIDGSSDVITDSNVERIHVCPPDM